MMWFIADGCLDAIERMPAGGMASVHGLQRFRKGLTVDREAWREIEQWEAVEVIWNSLAPEEAQEFRDAAAALRRKRAQPWLDTQETSA